MHPSMYLGAKNLVWFYDLNTFTLTSMCTIYVQVSKPRFLVKNDSSSAATDKQQAGRHLLAAKHKYLQSSWNKDTGQALVSYIKLEGVDSIGHVSFCMCQNKAGVEAMSSLTSLWLQTFTQKSGMSGDIHIPAFMTVLKYSKDHSDHRMSNCVHSKPCKC